MKSVKSVVKKRAAREMIAESEKVRPTLVAAGNMLEHQMKCKAEFADTEARSGPGGYGAVQK